MVENFQHYIYSHPHFAKIFLGKQVGPLHIQIRYLDLNLHSLHLTGFHEQHALSPATTSLPRGVLMLTCIHLRRKEVHFKRGFLSKSAILVKNEYSQKEIDRTTEE